MNNAINKKLKETGLISRPALWAMVSVVIVVGLMIALVWEPNKATPTATNKPLLFYCAAGMSGPVSEICKQYTKEYGVPIQLDLDGSGTLYSKMRVTRGKVHLYLAAEQWYTNKARSEGLVAESIPVAKIYPVLVVSEKAKGKIQTLNDLLKNDVRVALANPELASIGRTTKDLLSQAGLWEKIEQRRKSGATVSMLGTVKEVANAIRIGAADAGIVWDSTAKQSKLTYRDIPEKWRPYKTITISIVTGHERATEALQLARYLSAKDRGLKSFAKHDFLLTDKADVWAERPDVLFFAGAMLKPGIEQTLKRFEKREGVLIKPVYNGCGILVDQMKAGATPQAYLSCDVTFLEQVQSRFESGVTVSKNDMVFIVPKGNPKKITSLDDLITPDLRIGFAHPKNSALGKLTDDLLRRHGYYEKIYHKNNRILHTDAGHMLVNNLRAKALDVAIVYRSNAMSNPQNPLKYMDILDIGVADAVAAQPFAIAKQCKYPHLMQRLFDAITDSQTEQQFKSIGFHWAIKPKQSIDEK